MPACMLMPKRPATLIVAFVIAWVAAYGFAIGRMDCGGDGLTVVTDGGHGWHKSELER